MGWILQCLLWVSLTSTSAYNYRQHAPPYWDYSNYDSQVRRADYDSSNGGFAYSQLQGRSETNERPTQRMNERSISVTGGVQRVQEKERRRVQSWVEEVAPRSENGSYKIVNSHLKYPSISTRRGSLEEMKTSDSVVFPGQTSAQKFVPEIPKDCQEIGICETIPNYPHDVVNKIIARLGNKIKDRLQVDELEEPEIAQRIGPDDNAEIDLCNYRESEWLVRDLESVKSVSLRYRTPGLYPTYMIIKPQAAMGRDGNWYVILNKKDNPIQGYRVELCLTKGQTCAENIAYFYGGYTAVCKQKYVQRKMAAVDVEKEEILHLPFRIPSCCSCIAIHTG